MDIRKTYRMQQQYYSGFSFLPMRSVQKHNFFVYTAYNGHKNLNPLFETVLNKEVVDNNYIITIGKAIINISMPLTLSLTNELERSRDAISLFFRELPADDHSNVAYVGRTIGTLLRALGKFREVEKKLTDDLNNLLSSHSFTSLYKINTDQIDNILDVLHEVLKGIKRSIKRLSEFSGELPLKTNEGELALNAKNSVKNLIAGLQKWCRDQEAIIYQLQEWRPVRAAHERQEVLN